MLENTNAGNPLNSSRRAWAVLAADGGFCSRPYGEEELATARELLDFQNWIPWDEVRSVLCLAGGGGQQSALFASLGCRVTVVDLSTEQLALDRAVAEQHGFEIECREANMVDVGSLFSEAFDLVYQPISAHYTPDVRALYKSVCKTLRPGGYYWVEHWSPFQMQLAALDAWDGDAYRLAEPQMPRKPIPWIHGTAAPRTVPHVSWQYIHSLDDLIGGLCESGLKLRRFAERPQSDLGAEPGSEAHLAAYIPPFLALFAQRPTSSADGATRPGSERKVEVNGAV
ncbi:MAG: class I SAM-dependent methyltransferase [Acidobacteriaceae bacterium]|nr:class I SAM-dependent methyltransferase [Acidobacteriaceae bacterium]